MRLMERERAAGTLADTDELAAHVRKESRPLRDERDLDVLMDRIGSAHFVLLGEASHGTSDYYAWRQRISQRLIREKGFNFIAVEGDWPDCYRVNRYVKGYPDAGESAREVLHAFERWPTWMWANEEIVGLTEWLREHNRTLPEEKRVGFYGLDVYSLWESLDAVIRYLEKVDGTAVQAAKRAFRCFEPYHEDVQEYARATASWLPTSCEQEAIAMLAELRRELPQTDDNREARFVAEQNAIVVKNAETYYRTMVRGGSASWNVRDLHMVDTLDRLMRFHGPDAKGIVWEHNTHIGDARATDMARAGMFNVGQLVRERHERDGVVLVGFSGYQGHVIAGYEWGAPMQRMVVPPGREGSWEDVMHRSRPENQLLVIGDIARDDAARGAMMDVRGHRAIGVVYDPDFERYGNFVPTVLPMRYDVLLFMENTHALRPLHMAPHPDAEPPETYPWGV